MKTSHRARRRQRHVSERREVETKRKTHLILLYFFIFFSLTLLVVPVVFVMPRLFAWRTHAIPNPAEDDSAPLLEDDHSCGGYNTATTTTLHRRLQESNLAGRTQHPRCSAGPPTRSNSHRSESLNTIRCGIVHGLHRNRRTLKGKEKISLFEQTKVYTSLSRFFCSQDFICEISRWTSSAARCREPRLNFRILKQGKEKNTVWAN